MKKCVVLLVWLCAASASSFSQTQDFTDNIVRHCGNLYYAETGTKLDAYTLSQMLDNNQFDAYKQARREYIASIPLWTMAGAGATVSLGFLFGGLFGDSNSSGTGEVGPAGPYLFVVSGITMGVALLPGITALALTLDSHKKLNNVAENYNKSNKVTLNVKPVPQGIGVFINF